MAPLVIEGATLGKRHRHYNQLLKDVTTSRKPQPAKIDFNKTDIENLFNIDVACKNRDVEYILDVFKCEDMLYATRAIKRSTWLITDPQYAHIIDPEYLHAELFPEMMPKMSCKLLLHIRLNLKDKSRVQKFFDYFKEKDFMTGFKWLPNCSIDVINTAVEKHTTEIPPDVFGRLCEKSPNILEIFIKTIKSRPCKPYILEHLKSTMFLMRSSPELYLDALEKNDKFSMPTFNKKHTEILMKKCPERIINNFEKYTYCIHVDTFAKCLKKENIKDFILTQIKNNELKRWFDQDTINKFIKYMPKDSKYEFMKQFIDKTTVIDNPIAEDWCGLAKCAMSSPVRGGGASNSSTYSWFKYAPFDVAFPELKKLIRSESNPEERNAMLMILVANAGRNLANLHTLLQYYREKHINEPFRFKVQFVNDLIQKTDPHLYDTKIWSILDELFRSMEVYIESENNVQTCIKAIIVYKVTHDEPVPAIIEQKFNFDFLKPYQRKLKGPEYEKLFNYLFNFHLQKMNNHVISYQAELEEYVEMLKQGLKFLKSWNKSLVDYPIMIDKIRDCIKIKKEKGWNTFLAPLYETKKSWKKNIFEESLALSPSDNVCMNALKHDPELLVRHKNEVDALCSNDAIPMEKVLRKLRVYWPDSIATEWTAAYRERLDKPGGHKAIVRGLCSLLNQHQFFEFLKKYEPLDPKINWVDNDELQLSLRKNIAKSMHIARPQVTPDAILWYAKGDYVQFTQPSLNAVLYNLRPKHSRDCIPNLLNNTISLQKHAIHLAFAKLTTAEVKTIFEEIWKSTKNSSVRAVLIQNTHEMLCKEKDENLIKSLWELMQTFMDNLTADENKAIYNTFGKLAKVHESIKPAYCMKSYRFLKSLPPRADCANVLQKIKEEINNIIEKLDAEFVESIIEEFVNEVIVKESYRYQHRNDMSILTSYLLRTGSAAIQTERFQKVFVPLMDTTLTSWNKIHDGNCFVKQNFFEIIESLLRSMDYTFLNNKVNPSGLYRNILKNLENALPATQNIVMFRQLRLAAALVDVFNKNKPDSEITEKSQLNDLYSTCVSDVGKIVVKFLTEDVEAYQTLMYQPLAEALDNVFNFFDINMTNRLRYLKCMLDETDSIPVYLFVIQVLPSFFGDDQKGITKEIGKKIQSHPSPVVEIHYHMKFGTYPLDCPENN